MNKNSLIKILQTTIESQNKTIEGLREELKRTNENMDYLIQKLYGIKTEKTSAIDGQLLISHIELGLFNEAEDEKDSAILEPVVFEELIKKTRKGYKRKEKKFKDLSPEEKKKQRLEKEKLETYLEDGNCVISNNIAENSIRPFTVGRKNWNFCGSPEGANVFVN